MEKGTLLYDIIIVATSLETLSIFAAGVIGYIGVAIMTYGGVKSAVRFILSAVRRKNHLPYIRIDLGKHLALGLEFLVGKDIIETIIHPNWDDLGKLAAIVALRTAVTLMLTWELREIKEELIEEEEHRRAVLKLQKKKSTR